MGVMNDDVGSGVSAGKRETATDASCRAGDEDVFVEESLSH